MGLGTALERVEGSHISAPRFSFEAVELFPSVLRAGVYDEIRYRLVTGQIAPDLCFSTRRLAVELGVSQMPVREALGRLATEGALEIKSKRKISIPSMTAERFDDLLHCRLILEPDVAVAALAHMTVELIDYLTEMDNILKETIKKEDMTGYMAANYAFHFTLYQAAQAPTQIHLIETLWLQFSPFIRTAYNRFGTEDKMSQRQAALLSIKKRDSHGLHRAMGRDILYGMELILRTGWT